MCIELCSFVDYVCARGVFVIFVCCGVRWDCVDVCDVCLCGVCVCEFVCVCECVYGVVCF